jgi:hypothetical protein
MCEKDSRVQNPSEEKVLMDLFRRQFYDHQNQVERQESKIGKMVSSDDPERPRAEDVGRLIGELELYIEFLENRAMPLAEGESTLEAQEE